MNHEKTFLLDEPPSSFSAARAIRDMLSMRSKTETIETNVPLFCDPFSGKKMNLITASNYFSKKLEKSELSQLSLKGHSLRIGGATAYVNSGPDDCATAGFMGLWASSAKWRYMHAYQETLERVTLQVGRQIEGTLAVTPGPVANYANGTAI